MMMEKTSLWYISMRMEIMISILSEKMIAIFELS